MTTQMTTHLNPSADTATRHAAAGQQPFADITATEPWAPRTGVATTTTADTDAQTATPELPHPLFYGFLGIVVLSPLPIGLVTETAQSAYFLAASLIALGYCAWMLHHGVRPPVPLRRLAGVTLGFMIVLAWVALQAAAGTLPDLAHPLWAESATTLQRDLPGAISLSPEATRESLLRLVGYGVVFWLALQFAADRQRARVMLYVLIASATAVAAYGLIRHFAGIEQILWYDGHASSRNVSATFVNRNSFATWAGLALLLTVATLVARVAVALGPSMSWRRRWRMRIRAWVEGGLPLTAFASILLVALLLSNSRGGFVGTLIAMAMMLVVALALAGGSIARRLSLGGLVIGGVGWWLWYSGEGVLDRLLATDADSESRLLAYDAMRAGIDSAPLTGLGHGAFEYAFSLYRTPAIAGWVDRGHSDWLEAAFGLGLPVAAVLVLLLLALALRCLIGAFRRQRDRRYPIAAFGACVLIAVHSMVDFSLQIPAVTVFFLVVLALGVAQSFPSPSRRPRHDSRKGSMTEAD